MRILVTGGAGYVGCRLVPALAEAGHDVIILDAMVYGEPDFGGALPGSCSIIAGDIRDTALVRSALDGVDAVIHLAAISNDPSAELDHELTWSINVEAGIELISQAKRSGCKRFIFASSASIYGVSDRPSVTEDTPPAPLTVYARSKVEMERALGAAMSDDFTGIIVRPATLCGYSSRLRLDLTLNIFARQAWFDGAITVFGGSQMRPNLAIADMVRAYVMLAEAPTAIVAGRCYNIGLSNLPVQTLAELARDIVAPDVPVRIQPVFDERSYRLASGAIEHDLGFVPRTSLEEAVKELRDAFAGGLVHDPDDCRYHNIRMLKQQLHHT